MSGVLWFALGLTVGYGVMLYYLFRQDAEHEREIAHLKNQYHHKTTIVGSESVLRSIWKDEM